MTVFKLLLRNRQKQTSTSINAYTIYTCLFYCVLVAATCLQLEDPCTYSEEPVDGSNGLVETINHQIAFKKKEESIHD